MGVCYIPWTCRPVISELGGDEDNSRITVLHVMGCVNAKLVPDTPPSGDVVKTIYAHGQDPAKQNASRRLHHHHHHRTIRPHDDGQEANKPTRKAAKYRAKFDPRVTAKYDIKALIGSGTFSRVVRVENRITKQPYAIKMIDRIQGKELFESELAVLRRVKHTFIISLVEVFETREKVYMVMELATGGELFDRIIAKGSFTERDATRALKMVLEGVRYLHSLGITHRDLKPENLLYYHPGDESKIMITDFGLSSMKKTAEGSMSTTCGTPEYIAPEILARKPYTYTVDLWAVGVISYILLSGQMPFDDESRPRLYRLVLKAKYSYAGEHWKDVSALAKDFIDKLLVLDPFKRISSTEAMRHDWILTHAANSSNKNLHRTISQNLLYRQNRANSTRSGRSTKSNRSRHSLRSDNRHVSPEEIEELHRDPEVKADIESLHNYSLPSDRSVT